MCKGTNVTGQSQTILSATLEFDATSHLSAHLRQGALSECDMGDLKNRHLEKAEVDGMTYMYHDDGSPGREDPMHGIKLLEVNCVPALPVSDPVVNSLSPRKSDRGQTRLGKKYVVAEYFLGRTKQEKYATAQKKLKQVNRLLHILKERAEERHGKEVTHITSIVGTACIATLCCPDDERRRKVQLNDMVNGLNKFLDREMKKRNDAIKEGREPSQELDLILEMARSKRLFIAVMSTTEAFLTTWLMLHKDEVSRLEKKIDDMEEERKKENEERKKENEERKAENKVQKQMMCVQLALSFGLSALAALSLRRR